MKSSDCRKELLHGLLSTLVILAYMWPMWQHPAYWGIHDWPQFYTWYEIPRRTLLEYHQLPLWNPFLAGGSMLIGHPHSGFLSPFFLPVLVWGPVIGLKLTVVGFFVFGFWGMLQLSYSLNCDPAAQILAAVLWCLNGWFALSLIVGHVDHLPLLLLPWVVWAYLQQRHILAGFVWALMILSGGPYPFLMTGLFLAVFAVCQGILERSLVVSHASNVGLCKGQVQESESDLSLKLSRQFSVDRVLISIRKMAAITLWMLGFAAIKLIPMADFWSQWALVPKDLSSATLEILIRSLLDRHLPLVADYHAGIGSWEFSAYVGAVPLFLGLAGLILQSSLARCLVWTGAFFLALSWGSRNFIFPFPLLFHHLPLLESFHVPFRFIIIAIFSLSLLAALALTHLARQSSRWKKWILWILVLCTAADVFLVGGRHFKEIFSISPPIIERAQEFQQTRIGFLPAHVTSQERLTQPFALQMYSTFLKGWGIIDAYDPVHLTTHAHSAEEPNYRGEVFLASGRESAVIRRFTPNVLTVEVDALSNDFLAVNQNFQRGWWTKDIKVNPAISWNGLLATSILPGKSTVTFFYFPLSVAAGVVVSFITLVFCGFRCRQASQRERSSSRTCRTPATIS